MMKKKAAYSAPSMKVMELETQGFLCGSDDQKQGTANVTGPEMGGFLDFSDDMTSPGKSRSPYGSNTTDEE